MEAEGVDIADAAETAKTAHSKSNAGLWIAVIALILAIIALLIFAIIFIMNATGRRNPCGSCTGGCTYAVTALTTSATTLATAGCTVYQIPSSFTNTLAITPASGTGAGAQFVLDNSLNSNPVTITGGSGITIATGTIIPAASVTGWYWSSTSTIVRLY